MKKKKKKKSIFETIRLFIFAEKLLIYFKKEIIFF
jgi:hypothetical protein